MKKSERSGISKRISESIVIMAAAIKKKKKRRKRHHDIKIETNSVASAKAASVKHQ